MNWSRMSPGKVKLAWLSLVLPLAVGNVLAAENDPPRFRMTLVTDPVHATVKIHELTEPYPAPLTLPEGRYHVSVTAAGFQGEHGTIDIQGKDWSGLVRLTPTPPEADCTKATAALEQGWAKLRQEQDQLREDRLQAEDRSKRLERDEAKFNEAVKKLNKDSKDLAQKIKKASKQTGCDQVEAGSVKMGGGKPDAKPETVTPTELTAKLDAVPSSEIVAKSDGPAKEEVATKPTLAGKAEPNVIESGPADATSAATSPPSEPVPDEVQSGIKQILSFLQSPPSQQKGHAANLQILLDRLLVLAPSHPEVQRVKQLYEERYVVYVGTFSSDDKAAEMEGMLRSKSIPTFRQQFVIQGQNMLRVCAGLFDKRQDATNALSTIQHDFNIQDAIMRKFGK
ncbi:MAG: SPOR domain-containing protein [Magnetococcales bacterium]|nr:SPOR domain-containing protein [Magnetococcales bacterium]